MRTHLPCPDCGSSDALTDYGDHTYCFSCSAFTPLDNDSDQDYNELRERETQTLMTPALYRGLTKDTLDKYSVVFTDKEVIFPYSKDANKHRSLSNKSFYSSGPISDSPLFGKSLFPNGKYITITEGEFDAMSVYQMTGSKYPAISIRGSSSGKMDCKKEFKYLNSFERIYLCFDSDEPGQKAVAEVASLFNPNKVYHVKLNHFKDANDYLVNDAAHLFSSDWWNARPYLPTGIVGDYSSIEDILNTESAKPIATYPYHKLQDMTYGIRSGEVNLFTAQEKVGKTEVMKSLEYHLLTTTDLNIGIIHLEEPEKRTIQGLVGYDLKAPIHLPDHSISTKDTVDTFKKITKRDNRCFLYKHFGSDDPQVILDTIRYLVVACECKVVFLDHITMLVTGFKNEDERKTLDHVSTHLAMMTKELDFTLFLVSHVNDDGKTRGSRNISKIADLIVHMERDIEAESISVRNKTQLLIKGNRYAGLSGPSSTLWFDPSTFTYTELTDENADAILYPESQTPPSKMLEGSDSGSETLWVQASREADTTR